MQVIAGIFGFAVIAIVLIDAFETIILPRRVTGRFRLTRAFYRLTWLSWRWAAQHLFRSRKHSSAFLGFYGPLSLIVLLVIWAAGMILGFALLQTAFGSGLQSGFTEIRPGFATNLYFSGTTFTTLGLGDVHPATTAARILSVFEGLMGFGFLAIVIGYLPVVYQSFSERERSIALLDARAGSPSSAVEFMRRYADNRDLGALAALIHEWDHWAASLLESHISFPLLALYRSQHDNESWLAAITTIADVCALIILGIDDMPAGQAQLTFAMARHALVDLTQVLLTKPEPPVPDRLSQEDFVRMRETLAAVGIRFRYPESAESRLTELRRLYEPYVNALSKYLLLQVPSWFPVENAKDNWQTSAWEKAAQRIRPTELDVLDEHF
jgi:Ion channel